jgi:hypothetical protein
MYSTVQNTTFSLFVTVQFLHILRLHKRVASPSMFSRILHPLGEGGCVGVGCLSVLRACQPKNCKCWGQINEKFGWLFFKAGMYLKGADVYLCV